MCNACNNMCCDSDEFSACGCDGCDEPDCWSVCDICDQHGDACECFDGDWDDIGPDDIEPRRERPEFLG